MLFEDVILHSKEVGKIIPMIELPTLYFSLALSTHWEALKLL
jgi:hypothetical protein